MGEIHGHPVIEETELPTHHGGAVRIKGGFNQGPAEVRSLAQGFVSNVIGGLTLLESGQSQTPDARPVTAAPIEVFQYFDGSTGEWVIAWRVACRLNAH